MLPSTSQKAGLTGLYKKFLFMSTTAISKPVLQESNFMISNFMISNFMISNFCQLPDYCFMRVCWPIFVSSILTVLTCIAIFFSSLGKLIHIRTIKVFYVKNDSAFRYPPLFSYLVLIRLSLKSL